MTKNIITGLAALFLLASASALALDTSEPVLCASTTPHIISVMCSPQSTPTTGCCAPFHFDSSAYLDSSHAPAATHFS